MRTRVEYGLADKGVVTGVTSFAATNIDDIFLLTLFFGRREKSVRGWHIVLGQYLGFTTLVAISLIGYFARYVAPREWIGLLGFLPMAIGVKKLVEWKKAQDGLSGDEAAGINADSSVSTVAAVTFANGADNIGIYTPLFASSGYKELLTILIVFFILLAVRRLAGYYLSRHPFIARTLDRGGHLIVPFVLIGLGLFIFYESGALKFLSGFLIGAAFMAPSPIAKGAALTENNCPAILVTVFCG